MTSPIINILLADDDKDDCLFFQDALEELPMYTFFNAVNDGEQLMNLLINIEKLPDVLFLDLNMPRKNGFECLIEIKKSQHLKKLPVIIYSTSFDQEAVNILFNNGARYYIRKPAEFSKLKEVIHHALKLIAENVIPQPSKEEFVLQP